MSYISEVNGSMVAAPREGNALNATENEILEMLREGNDKGNAGFWIADVRKVSADGAVEILYGESGKAYNIEQDVQQVIDFLNNELGFDVFDGDIRVIGEDFPDISRIVVENNVAEQQSATVRLEFSDGTIEDL